MGPGESDGGKISLRDLGTQLAGLLGKRGEGQT